MPKIEQIPPSHMNRQKMDQAKFFKGCLPQVLLGPFLNTLLQMFF